MRDEIGTACFVPWRARLLARVHCGCSAACATECQQVPQRFCVRPCSSLPCASLVRTPAAAHRPMPPSLTTPEAHTPIGPDPFPDALNPNNCGPSAISARPHPRSPRPHSTVTWQRRTHRKPSQLEGRPDVRALNLKWQVEVWPTGTAGAGGSSSSSRHTHSTPNPRRVRAASGLRAGSRATSGPVRGLLELSRHLASRAPPGARGSKAFLPIHTLGKSCKNRGFFELCTFGSYCAKAHVLGRFPRCFFRIGTSLRGTFRNTGREARAWGSDSELRASRAPATEQPPGREQVAAQWLALGPCDKFLLKLTRGPLALQVRRRGTRSRPMNTCKQGKDGSRASRAMSCILPNFGESFVVGRCSDGGCPTVSI